LIGFEREKLIKMAGGRDHYLYPKIMHPDNELALNCALEALRDERDSIEQDDAGDFHSSGSFVCMGGPVSNLRTASFMGYERIDPSKPRLGMRSMRRVPFDLDIQFELDSERLKKWGRVVRKSVHGDATPEWAIRLGREGHDYLYTKAGEVDYLLVTRLPNWIEPKQRTSGKSNVVTIFAGCHGAGMGAVQRLFDDGDLLATLCDITDRHEYWQALIGIRSIGNTMHPVTHTIRHEAIALESRLVTYSAVRC
jgi:hypothetical protein